MRSMWMSGVLAGLLVAVAGVGCGGDSDGSSGSKGNSKRGAICSSDSFCSGQTIEFCMKGLGTSREACWYQVDDVVLDCDSCDSSGIMDCAMSAVDLCDPGDNP